MWNIYFTYIAKGGKIQILLVHHLINRHPILCKKHTPCYSCHRGKNLSITMLKCSNSIQNIIGKCVQEVTLGFHTLSKQRQNQCLLNVNGALLVCGRRKCLKITYTWSEHTWFQNNLWYCIHDHLNVERWEI